jgi:hypothetical protein
MSAGVEDRGGRDARSGTGFAPGHPPHRVSRTPHRIPTSPVSARPADPDPARSNGAADADRPATAGPPVPPPPPAPPDGSAPVAGTPGKQHHHHHVLIEPDEDRWAWRRRIRQNPHQLRLYRVGIAIAGLLLICLGLLSGPLPGPGGIPLVLLGLAVWSSEFEWAYQLRQRFKAEIRKFRGWSTRKKVVFWVVFFAACASFGYGYLLILGVPFWVPDVGAHLLDRLPGVKVPG